MLYANMVPGAHENQANMFEAPITLLRRRENVKV